MKRAMTWVAIGLILLGVALGGVVVLGVTSDWSFSFTSFTHASATLANRQTLDMDSINSLDIVYRSDDVTFVQTSGNELILEEYMSHPSDEKFARVDQSGDTLRIEQGERNSDWFMFYNVNYAIIYIPDGWHGDFAAECSSGSLRTEADFEFASIRLQANSGSLRFNGLQAGGGISMTATSGSVNASRVVSGGSVTLQANSGSVRVDSVQAAGPLTASTTSGSLNIVRIDAPESSMRSNSGSVRVGSITGEFDLGTTSGSIHVDGGAGHGSAVASSGSVRVTLDEVTGDMHLEATSGSVRFVLPRSHSFTFEAQTGSGSIKTDFKDDLSFNEKGNQATGTIGEDPEFHVSCKASSGSIKVER